MFADPDCMVMPQNFYQQTLAEPIGPVRPPPQRMMPPPNRLPPQHHPHMWGASFECLIEFIKDHTLTLFRRMPTPRPALRQPMMGGPPPRLPDTLFARLPMELPPPRAPSPHQEPAFAADDSSYPPPTARRAAQYFQRHQDPDSTGRHSGE